MAIFVDAALTVLSISASVFVGMTARDLLRSWLDNRNEPTP